MTKVKIVVMGSPLCVVKDSGYTHCAVCARSVATVLNSKVVHEYYGIIIEDYFYFLCRSEECREKFKLTPILYA